MLGTQLKGVGKLATGWEERVRKVIKFDEFLIDLGIKLLKRDFREFYVDLVKGLVNFGLFDLSYTPADFTKAKVFLPLTPGLIDGATIGNLAASLHQSNYGSTWVYGKVWYTESLGKKMFGNHDLLEVPASWSTQYQFPNVGGSFLGGPLFRL